MLSLYGAAPKYPSAAAEFSGRLHTAALYILHKNRRCTQVSADHLIFLFQIYYLVITRTFLHRIRDLDVRAVIYLLIIDIEDSVCQRT